MCRMFRAICAFALMILPALSAAKATPLRADLQAGLAAVFAAQDADAAQTAAHQLRARWGLKAVIPAATPAQPAFVTGGSAVVELVDLRLFLAQIAVQSGAKDHLVLTRAQPTGAHQVILLRGGLVSLAQLEKLAAGSAASAFVTKSAQGVTLTRALVVWRDAGLTLTLGDRVTLSGADGSFLANLGWLNIQGGSVLGDDMPNPSAPPFRPFVLTAGQGSLTIDDGHFAHLGFGETPRFGGVAVDNTGLRPPLCRP